MKYKLIQRINPQQATASKKWFATPVMRSKVDIERLSKVISGRSSLTTGDIRSVIENLIDVLPEYLLNGDSVNLGKLGTLRVSFSSEGVDNTDTFVINMIKGQRILFTASPDLKRQLDNLKFERT